MPTETSASADLQNLCDTYGVHVVEEIKAADGFTWETHFLSPHRSIAVTIKGRATTEAAREAIESLKAKALSMV